MNVTLLHLALVGSYGPVTFTPAIRRGVTSFSASGCRVQRYFSSFFSGTLIDHVDIRQSKFTHFQNSAIVVDAAVTTTKANITTQYALELRQRQAGFLFVTDCVFFSCKSERGGALRLITLAYQSAKDSGTTVERCTFRDCFASINGGAMYYVSMESNNDYEKENTGENFIQYSCIVECGLSDDSDAFPVDETASAIYLWAGGRDHAAYYSCYYITESSILNCAQENIESYVIAGKILRTHCKYLNITGSAVGNVGAFSSLYFDWWGNPNKPEGKDTFQFLHVTGLSCQSCFLIGNSNGDSEYGARINQADIVNISLLDGTSPASIFYRGRTKPLVFRATGVRMMDIRGTNIRAFASIDDAEWKDLEVVNCYTNMASLVTIGVPVTDAIKSLEISAGYLGFCKWESLETSVFAPLSGFAVGNRRQIWVSFAISSSVACYYQYT